MDRKEFLDKVENYILEENMIKKGDRIVIGLSGGADSVCLFSVLLNLKEKYGLSLMAVHVNHNIRGSEGKRDEEFAKKLCEENGIECKIASAAVRIRAESEKLTLEEAGRMARYEIFEDAASQWRADKIAVAHQENDLAETVLFNIFRGSSLLGLTGIRPVNGKVIRPLLCVDRNEIEVYLNDCGLSYCVDSTNLSAAYKRNLLRNEVFPVIINGINTQAVYHTARLAREVSETEEYMEEVTGEKYKECCKECGIEETDSIYIGIEAIKSNPVLIQKRIIKKALCTLAKSSKDITFKHIEMLRSLIYMENGKSCYLPYNMYGVREYERIRISIRKAENEEGIIIPVNIQKMEPVRTGDLPLGTLPPGIFQIGINEGREHIYRGRNISLFRAYVMEKKENSINIPKNDYTKWFDYDKISEDVVLRTRRTGDYMEIDKNGHKKKLKEIFINDKYPRKIRDRQLLLAAGSHVVWILGGRISEAFKITGNTERILVCELVY